jgi:hypothetical protein
MTPEWTCPASPELAEARLPKRENGPASCQRNTVSRWRLKPDPWASLVPAYQSRPWFHVAVHENEFQQKIDAVSLRRAFAPPSNAHYAEAA